MKSSIDYTPSFVDPNEVPKREHFHTKPTWKDRFNALPIDKAAKLTYNNRQRAHQVRNRIRAAAYKYEIAIGTRVIHEEPAIDGSDKWLVYYWHKAS